MGHDAQLAHSLAVDASELHNNSDSKPSTAANACVSAALRYDFESAKGTGAHAHNGDMYSADDDLHFVD